MLYCEKRSIKAVASAYNFSIIDLIIFINLINYSTSQLPPRFISIINNIFLT